MKNNSERIDKDSICDQDKRNMLGDKGDILRSIIFKNVIRRRRIKKKVKRKDL